MARGRIVGYSILVALLVVIFGPSRKAASQVGSATPTPIAPLIKNSGGVDNHREGNSVIECSAGTGLVENELIILAINALSGDTTIVAPPTSTGHPVWNLINSQPANNDYIQQLYWHQVGSAETQGPMFEFSFNKGQVSESVRAACAAAAFTHSCLDNASGACANPIAAVAAGNSMQSNAVTQTGDTGGAPAGQIVVPQNGVIFGAFGTSNTNSAFGGAPSETCNANGGFCPSFGGNLSGGLVSVNDISGNNGGLTIAAKHESSSVDGPFAATLPVRNDTMVQIHQHHQRRNYGDRDRIGAGDSEPADTDVPRLYSRPPAGLLRYSRGRRGHGDYHSDSPRPFNSVHLPGFRLQRYRPGVDGNALHPGFGPWGQCLPSRGDNT